MYLMSKGLWWLCMVDAPLRRRRSRRTRQSYSARVSHSSCMSSERIMRAKISPKSVECKTWQTGCGSRGSLQCTNSHWRTWALTHWSCSSLWLRVIVMGVGYAKMMCAERCCEVFRHPMKVWYKQLGWLWPDPARKTLRACSSLKRWQEEFLTHWRSDGITCQQALRKEYVQQEEQRLAQEMIQCSVVQVYFVFTDGSDISRNECRDIEWKVYREERRTNCSDKDAARYASSSECWCDAKCRVIENEVKVWHRRLEHVSWSTVNKSLKEGCTKGNRINPGVLCSVCATAKQVRETLKSNETEIAARKSCREDLVVCSGVWGQVTTASELGYRDVVTFMMMKSRYVYLPAT